MKKKFRQLVDQANADIQYIWIHGYEGPRWIYSSWNLTTWDDQEFRYRVNPDITQEFLDHLDTAVLKARLFQKRLYIIEENI